MAKKADRRSDGLIEKTIKDARSGKRIHFYGHTNAELNQKILEFTASSEKGRLFSEVAEEWHNIKWKEIAANSMRCYNPAYKRAVDGFGSQYIRQIRPQEIKRFINNFAESGMAKKTTATQLNILSMIFAHAVSEGDIDVSPCDHIAPPKNLKKTRREAASKEDEARVKAHRKGWLLPYLVLYTGLRKGEALALRYDDIDRKNGTISVSKSVYFVANKPFIKSPKTEAGNRTVPILAPLSPVLPKRGSGYLFSDDGGNTPISETRYQRLWKDYAKKTKITCSAHQLRHSYATMLFECEVDVKDAQDLLGHSTISMTQDIYTHVRDDHKKKTANAINAKLLEIEK